MFLFQQPIGCLQSRCYDELNYGVFNKNKSTYPLHRLLLRAVKIGMNVLFRHKDDYDLADITYPLSRKRIIRLNIFLVIVSTLVIFIFNYLESIKSNEKKIGVKYSHETKKTKIILFSPHFSPSPSVFSLFPPIPTVIVIIALLHPVFLIISYVVTLCLYKKFPQLVKVKGTHNLCFTSFGPTTRDQINA